MYILKLCSVIVVVTPVTVDDKLQEDDDLIYAGEYLDIPGTPKSDYTKRLRVRRFICRVCKLKFRTRQETQAHIRHEHISLQSLNILNNPTYTTELLSSVALLTILVLSCILCQPFLSSQFYEAEGSNSNQSSTQPSLPEIGTRFEAVGGIFSLPSINCLECEFRGIVEKSTASQYNMRGEVVGDSVSIIIPVLVLGTLNIHGSAINGILTISDKQYTVEGTSTTYSPTCGYCKQTLDLRGQSVQGDDVMSANIPLNII